LNSRGVSTSGFRDRRRGPSLATPAIVIVKSLIKPFFIWVSILVNIKVKISRTNENKDIQLEKGSTVIDVLNKLRIKPDTVVVMSSKTPIPIDEDLKDKQELTIIQVFSGG
jgi:sulfur carrier protein ThiS